MKLLDGPYAPNPRRVRIFMAEKGISVPLEPVDILKQEHKSDQFTSLNPMQRVPVLVLDDETTISESVAICRYFEALHPEPPLFGVGALEQALVEMWNRRMELELLAAVAAVFRHTHPAMKELEVPQLAPWADVNRAKVTRLLGWLNEELAGRRFIAGAHFTIADITAQVAIDFMKPARLTIPEELTHLRRWHAEVSARPSAKA